MPTARPPSRSWRDSRRRSTPAPTSRWARARGGTADVRVRADPWRRFAGRTFHQVVRLAGIRDIRDTQCGFKLFRRSAARVVFGELRTPGYAFDVEILLRAAARGAPRRGGPGQLVPPPGGEGARGARRHRDHAGGAPDPRRPAARGGGACRGRRERARRGGRTRRRRRVQGAGAAATGRRMAVASGVDRLRARAPRADPPLRVPGAVGRRRMARHVVSSLQRAVLGRRGVPPVVARHELRARQPIVLLLRPRAVLPREPLPPARRRP
jgi:hypothetical protein